MWSVTTGHQAVTSDVPIFYSRAEHFGCVTVKSIGARNLLNVCFPIWPASYVSFLCFVSFACDQDCLISSSLSVDQRYQQFRPPPMFPQWSCHSERDQKQFQNKLLKNVSQSIWSEDNQLGVSCLDLFGQGSK